MNENDILNQVLKLKPQERFLLVEGILKSLDQPDKNLDDLWTDEAQKRLNAYKAGKLKTYSMDEVFKDR
ncbi:MAG: addiction module protein [Cellvibrio sp.]|nr:addiction module protein [Cellvibrio sp.]